MVGKLENAEDQGFDGRNYTGQFAMDIVDSPTKEKGCFIQRYREAENLSRQGQDICLR